MMAATTAHWHPFRFIRYDKFNQRGQVVCNYWPRENFSLRKRRQSSKDIPKHKIFVGERRPVQLQMRYGDARGLVAQQWRRGSGLDALGDGPGSARHNARGLRIHRREMSSSDYRETSTHGDEP